MKTHIILLFALLSLTCSAFADTTPTNIPCPCIPSIQQAKDGIDTASPYWSGDNLGMFITSSSRPVINESNLAWSLHVWGVAANSSADAILKAKDSLQTLNIYTQFADLENNELTCRYNWSEHSKNTPALVKLTAQYR